MATAVESLHVLEASMIITVSSFKGGVGKSTTAIHLAAFFQKRGSTILVDGDLNRCVLDWAERGNPPFKVVDQESADQFDKFKHVIIDTPARPSDRDLIDLAESSDMLVIPSAPDPFSLIAQVKTTNLLTQLPKGRYKVLLTICPPPPSREGDTAYQALINAGLPVFKRYIRRFAAYSKASLLGVPVYAAKDAKARIAWSDYEAVGQEILGK